MTQDDVRDDVPIYFSDVFDIPAVFLDDYGAFNVSLVNDLPLFIDPFLLFHSPNPTYEKLHDNIITYLRFLRDKAQAQHIDDGLLTSWFQFKEVKQTWLGLSENGNSGRGLGPHFAKSLRANLGTIFTSFGWEQVTRGSHLEKVCLIGSRVGRGQVLEFL